MQFLTKMAVKKDSSTKSDWILIPSQNPKSLHWQIPPGHNGNIQIQGSLKYRAEPQARACSETKDVLNQEKENLFFFFFWKHLNDDESKETFASLFQNLSSESFLWLPLGAWGRERKPC